MIPPPSPESFSVAPVARNDTLVTCLSGRVNGTCDDPACPLQGKCHCRCGNLAPIAGQGRTRVSQTKGQPFLYRRGHAPGNHHGLRSRGFDRRAPRVPMEDIRWAVSALVDHYGSCYAASKHRVGASYVTLWTIHTDYRGDLVQKRTAERLAQAVYRLEPFLPIAPLVAWRERHDPMMNVLSVVLDRAYYRALKKGHIGQNHADLICMAWGTSLMTVYWDEFNKEMTE